MSDFRTLARPIAAATLAAAAVLVAACGGPDPAAPLVGRWVIDMDATGVGMKQALQRMDPAEAKANQGLWYMLLKAFEQNVYQLRADGSYRQDFDGGPDHQSSTVGTWRLDGEWVVLHQTHENDALKPNEQRVHFVDGRLRFEADDGKSLTTVYRRDDGTTQAMPIPEPEQAPDWVPGITTPGQSPPDGNR